jgi:hypothetical protein
MWAALLSYGLYAYTLTMPHVVSPLAHKIVSAWTHGSKASNKKNNNALSHHYSLSVAYLKLGTFNTKQIESLANSLLNYDKMLN